MKAIICTKYGEPEVLQLIETDKPVPKDYEVLVKIITTSVTASDCIIRGFTLPLSMWILARLALGIKRPRKKILGLVLAGIIENVGDKVSQFKIGDKVYAHTFMQFGAYAEYICLSESSAISIMPLDTSFEEATAIPYGGTLALYFLTKAKIQKGQKILIYGASGSIGTIAIQLAKSFGAEVVGVCSNINIELVKSLGADSVMDYTKKDFTLDGGNYDLIFDAVGRKKSSHLDYKKALNLKGRFISVDDGNPGTKAVCKENLKILKDLVDLKKVKPVIDRVYPLEEIVEAHRYVDKGHKKGNVIITIC